MTQQNLRPTAYHEAGHAVLAWSLGLAVGTISVNADDLSGETKHHPADHLSWTEQIALRRAGEAACDLFGYPADHEQAYWDDMGKIIALFTANGISHEKDQDVLRKAGYQCARTVLESHKNKVERLAERLVVCGSIDSAEFSSLMA